MKLKKKFNVELELKQKWEGFFKILGLKRQMKKLKTQSYVDFSSSKGQIGIVCCCNNGRAMPLSIADDHFVGTRNRKASLVLAVNLSSHVWLHCPSFDSTWPDFSKVKVALYLYQYVIMMTH